ncbi:hypothetical protein Sango_0539300 [Sesamum angolense]|uniref:ATP synthase subunit e, mitochondrial n=1 Tax=Sesamum angolense TaxID=2727404 RepID=A0AAE1X5S2_9LAMI|nr:hypothetical protein Sango_0539300 [Sesamum angolense]
MAPPPGPYSGKSTLALVARVSAFTFGLAYGSLKLKILKFKMLDTIAKEWQMAKAKSHKKAEAKGHH